MDDRTVRLQGELDAFLAAARAGCLDGANGGLCPTHRYECPAFDLSLIHI